MDDFYIVIPSNFKNRSGERNTTSTFTTYLPRLLELDKRSWRVALVQIDYPLNWMNISGVISRVDIERGTGFQEEITVPWGYYKDGHVLANTINTLLKNFRLESRVKLLQTELFYLACKRDEKITIHPTLAGLMGFDRRTFVGPSKDASREFEEYYSVYPWEPRSTMYNIYVYSDLVSETIVGDRYVPLLQTLPVRDHDQRSGFAHEEFLNPHYMPLQTGSFSSIKIQLCDETGNPVFFTSGRVIVKLHFKSYDGERTN